MRRVDIVPRLCTRRKNNKTKIKSMEKSKSDEVVGDFFFTVKETCIKQIK